MKESNQQVLQQVGAWITISAFAYLIAVLFRNTVPLNIATWGLWTILDAVLTRGMYKSNHPAKRNMLAFTIGAGAIALLALSQLVLNKTTLTWSGTETLTLVCFLIAFSVRWISSSDKLTTNAGTTAMFIAGIPSLVDTWNHPKSADPFFWGLCALGGFVTFLGTKKGFTNRYMPVGGTIFNGTVAVLALVK